MAGEFKALLLEKGENGQTSRIATLTEADLMEGDVTVAVSHSTINYKDGLALTGAAPVVRRWPMVPGIDFAGVVESSQHPDYKPGDKVILNGWGVGETHWGCLAGRARLKGDWLVPLPAGLSTHQAMAIGTAGYTAMLCVLALERQGLTPDRGPVLVTGAAGGVGTIAVSLLSRLGYSVVAATGRAAEADFLRALGAKEILDRASLSEPGKPLGRETWAGAIDVAGGQVLANVCAQMQYRGVVAACGLAAGMSLPVTVAPFILRGVTLAGVDSVMAPRADRIAAWSRLARDLDLARLESLMTEVRLENAIDIAPQILAGQVRGRLVIPVDL